MTDPGTDTPNYLTEEILAFVGVESEAVHACDPIEVGALRRFAQAIMDSDPTYCGAGRGDLVAPPLYPLHALRRAPGAPDPLDEAIADPDFDGAGQGLSARLGLPALPLPFKRMLNGGNDVEIYDLARLGDVIVARSRYREILQKHGRSGPMIVVIVETEYSAGGRLLLRSRQTQIWR
jgi:N-terminal half of MaoC dehydratase